MSTAMIQPAAILADGWLTTEETCRALGKARRTVQELAQRGALRWQLAERPGLRPERLYQRADVERLKAGTPPPVDTIRRPVQQRLLGPPPAPLDLTIPAPVQTALVRLLEHASAERVSIAQKLWLSLDEAAAYSGLARHDLLGLARAGALVARKSGGWKLQRASLESFNGGGAAAESGEVLQASYAPPQKTRQDRRIKDF